MQIAGDNEVGVSTDIVYAGGEGKFTVTANFSLGGKSFNITPCSGEKIKMTRDPIEIAGNTMTCTFQAVSA